MKNSWKKSIRLLGLFLLLFILVSAVAVSKKDDNKDNGNPNPGIMPSNNPHYADLDAEWWQWAFSMPVEGHPLNDPTGDYANAGQSGNVWFLGSSIVSEETEPGTYLTEVNREITIPSGTKLFIPIWNEELSTLEGYPTEDEQRSKVEADMNLVSIGSVLIDGKPVENPDQYKSESSQFDIGPLPENNMLGAETGATGEAVAGGYGILLPPLNPGEHTIEYTATYEGDFTWTQDVSYVVTVEPGNKAAEEM